jgi:hypothetical protein
MGYERAMYFKKEAAPLSLSYFGLGGSKSGGFGFSKPAPPEIDGPVRVAQGPILRSSISAVNFSDTRLSTRV